MYTHTLFGAGVDNDNPRAATAALAPNTLSARLYNAHVNMQESFPLFAVPLVLCIVLDKELNVRAKLSLVFVISRVLYELVYALNLSTLRSIFYHFGFASSMLLAAMAALPRGETPHTVWHWVISLFGLLPDMGQM